MNVIRARETILKCRYINSCTHYYRRASCDQVQDPTMSTNDDDDIDTQPKLQRVWSSFTLCVCTACRALFSHCVLLFFFYLFRIFFFFVSFSLSGVNTANRSRGHRKRIRWMRQCELKLFSLFFCSFRSVRLKYRLMQYWHTALYWRRTATTCRMDNALLFSPVLVGNENPLILFFGKYADADIINRN